MGFRIALSSPKTNATKITSRTFPLISMPSNIHAATASASAFTRSRIRKFFMSW